MLIEHNKRKIFFSKKHAEDELRRLVPDLLFKKALYWVNANGVQLNFNYISIALKLAYNKNELYKTGDY